MKGIWRIHALARSLGSHAAVWDHLNHSLFGQHPLQTAAVVEQLLQCFGRGDEVLCELQVAGQTQALCVLRPEGRFVWRSFLPSQTQLGLNLLADASDLRGLFAALPFTVIQLDLLCQDPLLTSCDKLQAPRAHLRNQARTVHVDLREGFEHYLAARSKNLRANLRRYQSRVQSEGLEMRFVCHREPDAVEAAVQRYADLEGQGWKGSEGTALASFPEQFRFYRNVLVEAAGRGDAHAYELYFGDQLAGSRLTLGSNRTLVILKTTYDEGLARLAPGRLHLMQLIESACAQKRYDRIEFYTDANAETLTWATGARWIHHLTLQRSPLLGLGIDVLRSWRKPLPEEAPEGCSVQQVDRLDALPPEALSLLDAQAGRGISLGSNWIRNLEATVFTDPARTRYVYLQKDDRVLAVLPLLLKPRRGKLQLSALANYYSPLFAPALHEELRPAQLAALLASALRIAPGAALLRLEPLDESAPEFAQLTSALRLLRLPAFQFHCFDNWSLTEPMSWPAYLASREGSLRSTLKRKGARFAKEGGRLEILKRPEELERGLLAYQQVYASSWKRPEPYPGFIPGLLSTYAERGELRLGLAYLGEQPVGAQIWLVRAGRAEIHKLAYDDSQRNLSPGSLLTAHLMQHVMEHDRVILVDFLTGDDAYKASWMNRKQGRHGLLAFNPRFWVGLLGLCTEWLAWATRRWRRKDDSSRPPATDPSPPSQH